MNKKEDGVCKRTLRFNLCKKQDKKAWVLLNQMVSEKRYVSGNDAIIHAIILAYEHEVFAELIVEKLLNNQLLISTKEEKESHLVEHEEIMESYMMDIV